MSIRVMSKVWDSYPGGGTELLALLALADWSDDDGRCFPSMASIAKKIRLSRSQAQRTVHSLINANYIAVIGNEFGGARGSSRKYQILIHKLTGSTDATGGVHATGSRDAHDGSHACGDTGSTHATQTINEPSKEPSDKKSSPIPLKKYLEICKDKNVKPIPDDSSVFEFAAKANIPLEYLKLGWYSFRDEHIANDKKKQANWPLTFLNYVRNDYLKVWSFNKEGECFLTTKGKQLEKFHAEDDA